jgi:hypothetical protein
VTNATDRFKMLLAGALERVCVLEAELEETQERLAVLEAAQNGRQEVTHQYDGPQHHD